jgi:choline dehydrogenase-like flavoprotein
MLSNDSSFQTDSTSPFDVLIVGAGLVGIFCAVLLERQGFRVAVAEGGALTPDASSNRAYTRIIGRPHSTTSSGRAMGLGGTGLVWGGQLSEFSLADIEGGKGYWPIDYGQLRALYDRVYERLGLPTRLDDASARATFGGDEGVVDGVERIFSCWLPIPNFASLFRDIIVGSRNISVFTNCKVVGFQFDEAGRAIAARLRWKGGEHRVAAGRFVVAGGVVESSRLLLAARRDHNCPWREATRIGCLFQDHIGGELGSVTVLDEQLVRDRFELGFHQKIKYMPKLRFSGAVEPRLSVCGFPIFRSRMDDHLANLKLLLKAVRFGVGLSKWREMPGNVMAVGATFAPLVARYMRHRRIMATMDQGIGFAFQCEQMPRPESRVTLASHLDADDGLPTIELEWRTGSEEGVFLRSAALHFARYLERTGCAKMEIDEDLLNDPPAFLARSADTSHPSGGLCMSGNRADGVTDPNSRVWGAPNVYAAGASILATSGEANITLTALAMTLRLTDHLVASHRRQREGGQQACSS